MRFDGSVMESNFNACQTVQHLP